MLENGQVSVPTIGKCKAKTYCAFVVQFGDPSYRELSDSSHQMKSLDKWIECVMILTYLQNDYGTESLEAVVSVMRTKK